MMRRFFLCALAAAAISGCRQRTIKIVMERAKNGEIIREADVEASDDGKPSDIPEEELLELEALYGQAVENVEKRYSFARRFKGELPQDMVFGPYKNSGRVITINSPLGTLIHYVERMPGPSEPYEILRSTETAVDVMIRAMSAYFERVPELRENSTKRKKLKQFLDGELRADLMNAALMVGSISMHAQRLQAMGPQGQQILGADMQRIVLYLHERGYLEREEIPKAAGFELIQQVWPRLLCKVGEAVGAKPNKPLPDYLARLENNDDLKAAFQEGLLAIDVTEEEFEEILAGVYGSGLDGLKIEVTWRAVPKPVLSNGLYDAAKAQVIWSSEAVQQPSWPEVLYAIWADGDEDFMEKHLGLMLPDATVKDHNLWYAKLNDDQSEEWRDFLRSLDGDDSIVERIREFRFTHADAPTEEAAAPVNEETSKKDEPVAGASIIFSGIEELRKQEEAVEKAETRGEQ